jgi:enamine deaminase RidA (YjgF/YER057c/UK114 family)
MNKMAGAAGVVRSGRLATAMFGAPVSLGFGLQPGESVAGMFARLARELETRQIEPVLVLAFGSVEHAAEAATALAGTLGERTCPMTWVEGLACDDGGVAGVQVFGARAEVERVRIGNRVAACVFEDGAARHCVVGSVTPPGREVPAGAARRAFQMLEGTLAQAGFGLGDVVRTWFFLDDLLAWYDAFNRVRAEVYERTRFRAGCLPASTGVAARNPAGAWLSAAAWAIQPLNGATRVVEAVSPLQGPAAAYGSWFSRAVEVIGAPDAGGAAGVRRHLWISGTASIAPDGRTLHPGRARAQIEHTMRVVEAILESRGYGFGDVTRAVAYFRSARAAPLFGAWLERRECRRLPVLSTVCGICRRELEFEIELDAAR